MKCKRILICLLSAAAILLTGCSMRTIDQMYCLPKRSEEFTNLQSAMDGAMTGLEYHAPISGENQQPVQMVDLDGDGISECLVFARGTGEKPLKILIFSYEEEKYALMDTLEGNGTAFEQVQYVHFTDRPGLDLVVARQVSDQGVRPVSVYTLVQGKMEQVLTTQYSRFASVDLDNNGLQELMVLRPGDDPAKSGIAEVYGMHNGVLERSQEAAVSEPADKIKRVMVNKLQDGPAAVYVASDVGGNAVITDVYAMLNGTFSNVSLSNESGTSVQTMRNYYVYADDIDEDGILELPDLIPLTTVDPVIDNQQYQYLVRWYAMNSDGSTVNKLYTYHSFTGGWYLELSEQFASGVGVTQFGNSYGFSTVDEDGNSAKLMTIYVFTGQEREEQAVADNRFVLHRTESTVYAAHLEVASASYGLTRESLVDGFHLITQDLTNGEW